MKTAILAASLIALALISCGILDNPKDIIAVDSTIVSIDTTIHKIDSALVNHDTIKK